MKSKAFTLIELLAVIVILAIIALIATLIILGNTKDARENPKKKSAELVYTGVEYAYTQALFKEGDENVVDGVTLETIDKYLNIDNVLSHGFEEDDTNKEELHILTKDNVYCKVTKNISTKVFEVSCGTDKNYTLNNVMETKIIAYNTNSASSETNTAYTQKFKPQYYTFDSFSGTIGATTAPEEASRETVPPTGHDYYLGYDVGSDGKVSAAYSCFIRNEKEYCLKGTTDGSLYEDNKGVLRDAFADVVDAACTFDTHYNNYDRSYCSDSSDASSYSDGYVYADDGEWVCSVNSNGNFRCKKNW